MPTTPSYYVNSPTANTEYIAPAGYYFIPSSGSVTVTVKTWTGANGTGSLIAVTTLIAIARNITGNVDASSNSAPGANTSNVITSNGVNGTNVFAAAGKYTGTTPGSMEMFASYTGSPVVPSVSGFSPTAGGYGSSVTITGSNFTGATAVSFNGTAASFSVTDDSHISATVPTGATTGTISVSNPSGTGTSAASFTVAQAYVNTGTPAAPVWTAGIAQVNTGTPAAPVWTVASQVAANTGTPAAPVWTPSS